MKFRLFLILSLTLLLAACGAGDKNSTDKKANESSSEKLHVYTTVFPLYSMTKEIGGDTVEVESVYPKNVNMHTYEPSQKDILKFADGDLFIYTHDDLDPVAKKIKETIGDHTEPLAAFNKDNAIEDEHHHDHEGEEAHDHDHESEEAHDHNHEGEEAHDHEGEEAHDHDHEGEHDHHHGEFDPHVWLDPNLSLQMAQEITKKLSEMQPEHKDLYEENLKALEKDLKELDSDLEGITKDKKRDTVYISHESIGYLAHRYGFEQVGISGLNNEEPSQKALAEIVTNIKSQNTPYILYEQNISSKMTDMVGKETDTEFLPFHNLETLTDKDPEDATYQNMMKENIKSLDEALNK